MKHPVRFESLGGWGYPDPAPFALELSRGAAYARARKSGVRRYGKAPDSSDDTRPVATAYRHVVKPAWINRAGVTNLAGNALASLTGANSLFGGSGGFDFGDGTLKNPHAFGLPISLGVNESLAFRCLVHNVDGDGDEAKGHVWFVRLGDAAAGVLLQIRDGNPEIARLATTWTREGESELHDIWALKSPDADDDARAAELIEELYSSFETLSFERNMGRDTWRGQVVFLTLLTDPAGALQIILEGADSTRIEFPDLSAARDLGTLWREGASVEVGASGGGWMLQPLGLSFPGGSMKYGPYFSGSDLGDAQFSAQYYSQKNAKGENIARVTFAKVGRPTSNPEPDPDAPPTNVTGEPDAPEPVDPNTLKPFYFTATFTTTDDRYPAYLSSFTARLENGQRTGLDDTAISFDSSAISDLAENEQELDSYKKRDKKPICEVQISCDESGRRSATVSIRDINGRALMAIPGGIDGLVGRVANLKTDGAAAMTQAVISRGRLENASRFARLVNGLFKRNAADVAKATTRAELTFDDGHLILEETLCDPPVISDAKRLGFAIRQRLRLAGYSFAEMARVPADFGPILPSAAPGEPWAVVSDENDTVSSSIDGLLDRFGLGLRFYQDVFGVWVLEKRPTQSIAAFTSDSTKNDPNGLRKTSGGTRYIILSAFDWERDNRTFFNSFRVVGGLAGEIVRDYVDTHSMQSTKGAVANAVAQIHARWVGRPKPYATLRDTGLRTVGQVLYALRSLVDRYNRIGKFATFETYFVRHFYAGDLVTVDGVLCEIVSYEIATKTDRMQIRVREVI